jgi:hypothetical protein
MQQSKVLAFVNRRRAIADHLADLLWPLLKIYVPSDRLFQQLMSTVNGPSRNTGRRLTGDRAVLDPVHHLIDGE